MFSKLRAVLSNKWVRLLVTFGTMPAIVALGSLVPCFTILTAVCILAGCALELVLALFGDRVMFDWWNKE